MSGGFHAASQGHTASELSHQHQVTMETAASGHSHLHSMTAHLGPGPPEPPASASLSELARLVHHQQPVKMGYESNLGPSHPESI